MREYTITSDKGFTIGRADVVFNGVTIKGENLEVRDEYHSMHELYQHRMALNIGLFNYMQMTKGWESYSEVMMEFELMKSKLHHDGTMFDGYFIVMLIVPNVGQISYHYKLKHWDEFRIPEVERTPKWDGHSSNDVIERLMKL